MVTDKISHIPTAKGFQGAGRGFRWLSPDPLGEAGGMNLYGYVGNDPVTGLDLFGLKECNGGAGKPTITWGKRLLSFLKKLTGGRIAHPRVGGKPGPGALLGPIDTGVRALEAAPDVTRILGNEFSRQRLFDSDFSAEDLEKYDNRKWQDGFKKCEDD